jgi:hypothetical protein
MDMLGTASHHTRVRLLPHIKRLDDCFGDFLVRVVCECGACREIQPRAISAPYKVKEAARRRQPPTRALSIQR